MGCVDVSNAERMQRIKDSMDSLDFLQDVPTIADGEEDEYGVVDYDLIRKGLRGATLVSLEVIEG